MDEIGAAPVADRMDPVHVAVEGRTEPTEIEGRTARLGVRGLPPGHQGYALLYGAVRVGAVCLGDHQVDHRLDPGCPAFGPSRGRCIEHRDVDPRRRVAREGDGVRCPRNLTRSRRDARARLRKRRPARAADLATGARSPASPGGGRSGSAPGGSRDSSTRLTTCRPSPADRMRQVPPAVRIVPATTVPLTTIVSVLPAIPSMRPDST